jgi:PAS domain S-box-containing protein
MDKSSGLLPRPDVSRKTLTRYAVAILVSALCIVLRWYIWRGQDDGFPYAAMFLPVAFSAYYGGFGPGLASVLVILSLGNYFFVPPPFSLAIPHTSTLLALLAFSATGLFISILGEANRRARTQDSATEVQKIAQDNFRASEERLHVLENLISAGAWDWNIQTNEVYWSDGYRRLLDYPLDEVPTYDKGVANIHPDDRGRAFQVLEDLFRQRLHNWALEYRILTAAGRTRWVAGNAQISYDEQGKPVRMVGIYVDITARKAAEQGLRDNEARLRLLLEGARVGGWEWVPGQHTSIWSDALYDVLGLDRSLPSSFNTWLSHIHPEDREYMRQLTNQLSRGTEERFQYEYRIIGSDGIERYIHERGMILRDSDRPRLIGVSLDMTDNMPRPSYQRSYHHR